MRNTTILWPDSGEEREGGREERSGETAEEGERFPRKEGKLGDCYAQAKERDGNQFEVEEGIKRK